MTENMMFDVMVLGAKLLTDFEGNKSCKEIPEQKYPTLKKILHWKNFTLLYVGEEYSISRGLGKKSHPNQITHTSLKSQMVGPRKKLKGYTAQTSMPGNIKIINYSQKRYYYVIPVLWRKCQKMSLHHQRAA